MAGSASTISESTTGSVKRIKFTWTCDDATGAVTSALTTKTYDGEILRLVTDPGTPAPTALYDVEIQDADGFDVLIGQGANRSATVTESVATGLGATHPSKLKLVVTNAGAANNQGIAYVWIR